MTNQVHTCDETNRQSAKVLGTSDEAAPVKSRRQVCYWKSCGVRFANQKELSAHVNDDHVRLECPDVDFQCHWEGCPRQGRGFNARYKMLIHIRTHTNEKPHMCGVCNKSFSRLENLKIHTRSHTGERPYSCTFPGCSKAYSNSSDRFKHIRTHQEQKPYKCKMPGCRKEYTDPSSLRKHVRTHRHTPDSSIMELHPSLSSNTHDIDLKMEVCSSLGDTLDGQDYLGSRHVCQFNKYVNTACHRLQKQDLTNDNFQTIYDIQNSTVDSPFSSNVNGNKEDLTKAVYKQVVCEDEKSNICGYRDALGPAKYAWQHQNTSSYIDIKKSCPCINGKIQNMSYIKQEPRSETQSPASTSLYSIDEQVRKKEHQEEEHRKALTCTDDHLHKGNERPQRELSSTACRSPLPTHDLSDNSSLQFSSDENCDSHQKTKMSSSSSPPVLNQRCCIKSPKLEHWKKRKLLISEKEFQTSPQSPTSNEHEWHRTVPVSPNSLSNSETPFQSVVPHVFHLSTTTSISPLTERHSPLPPSHMPSTSHGTTFRTPTCPTFPRLTPTLAPEPSSSTPLSPSCQTAVPSLYSPTTPLSPFSQTAVPSLYSPTTPLSPSCQTAVSSLYSPTTPLSPSCQTAVPSLYLLHHNPPLLYPFFSNPYSQMSAASSSSINSSPFYTRNLLSLALSGSTQLPIPNSCHYDSTVDHHLRLNRTYTLPSGPTFNHSECPPSGEKNTWDHPGFNSLPLLMNLENTSFLSPASFNYFTNRLGLIYQDISLDLPSLYQRHGFRLPRHLGVNR